jgi:hypothetical protein
MTDDRHVHLHFHVAQRGHGRVLREGPRPVTALTPGRVPRIARLVALAHKFEAMLRRGEIECMAEIARLGHVSRARVTQIMDLTLLAPDLQEELLHLPPVKRGQDPITLRELRYVMQTPVWEEQRLRWEEIAGTLAPAETAES